MHGHHHSHEGKWAAGRRRHWRFGGGFGGRHGGRFDEGGEDLMRARRMLAQGDLRLVALALIAEAPRHGYEIIKLLEEKTSDWYSPSPGIVYPTLTLLEDLLQVEAKASEGAKKLYAITPAGLEHLNAHRAEAEHALARLDALGRKEEAFEEGPVYRAMGNLKAALRQRLAGPSDKALRLAVADAIDEAARKIERL